MNNWSKTVPKAVLHDHLDGGLRVSTLIELANKQNYTNLPSTNTEDLLEWIQPKPNMSLALNLEAWDHTIAVMQDTESIYRVTMEALELKYEKGSPKSEIPTDKNSLKSSVSEFEVAKSITLSSCDASNSHLKNDPARRPRRPRGGVWRQHRRRFRRARRSGDCAGLVDRASRRRNDDLRGERALL